MIGAMENGALNGKRVLYILPQPFFLTRGSSFRALATIRALAELGLEVDLIAFPLGADIQIDRVSVLRSARLPWVKHVPIGPSFIKILMDFLLLLRCLIQIFRKDYAVIHGVEEGGIIAAILGKIKGRPYIFDMHSWMSAQLEDSGFTRPRILLQIFTKIETYCIKGAAAVITVGSALTDKALSLAPRVPGITLEDHALDVTRVNPYAKEDLREEFELHGKSIVLYTGNFEAYQGIELLLDGFADMLRSQMQDTSTAPNAVLLLVGGGNSTSTAVSKYIDYARTLGITDRVIFAGQRGLGEIAVFMDMADVLVSPRIQGDNTPLKIYSYMLAGKIIVATRIRSHTQVLADENALLADPNPNSIAKALAQALDNSPQAIGWRAEKLARAKDSAEKRFNQREFVKRIASCYVAVLNSAEITSMAQNPQ